MNLYLLFSDATIWDKLEVFFSYSSQHNMSVQPNVVTVIHIYNKIPLYVYNNMSLLKTNIVLGWNPALGINAFLLQIALTSEHHLIMLIDILFPVISTTQSLIPPTQIFPIGYSDITDHRSHNTLHFHLFVSLHHTQHATSMSNPTSIKTFTPDARSIFIPCFLLGSICLSFSC